MYGLCTAPSLPWLELSSEAYDAATVEIKHGQLDRTGWCGFPEATCLALPPITTALVRNREYDDNAYEPHREDPGDDACGDGSTDEEGSAKSDEDVEWRAGSDGGADLEGWIEFGADSEGGDIEDGGQCSAGLGCMKEYRDAGYDWSCDVAGLGCLRPDDRRDRDDAHICHEDGERTVCEVCFAAGSTVALRVPSGKRPIEANPRGDEKEDEDVLPRIGGRKQKTEDEDKLCQICNERPAGIAKTGKWKPCFGDQRCGKCGKFWYSHKDDEDGPKERPVSTQPRNMKGRR